VLMTVSFFYIANFIGAFAAGMSNVYLTDRFGFGLVSAPQYIGIASSHFKGHTYGSDATVYGIRTGELRPAIPDLCVCLHL